jgi:hypothetical protein
MVEIYVCRSQLQFNFHRTKVIAFFLYLIKRPLANLRFIRRIHALLNYFDNFIRPNLNRIRFHNTNQSNLVVVNTIIFLILRINLLNAFRRFDIENRQTLLVANKNHILAQSQSYHFPTTGYLIMSVI